MKRLSTFGVVLGLVLLFASALPAMGDHISLFEGSGYRLPAGTTSVVQLAATGSTTLPVSKEEPPTVDLSSLPEGQHALLLEPSQKTIRINLRPHKYGYLAALGALLFLLGLPGVLIPQSPVKIIGEEGRAVNGWLYLLVDQAGLNLGRVLLVIFYLPSAVVFLTLAFALHQMPDLPPSIWYLLGFGGAAVALEEILPNADPSAVKRSSGEEQRDPEQPEAGSAPDQDEVTIPRPPRLSDLFRNPKGYGDISHFQAVVISFATAAVFLMEFFDSWVIPPIPDQVLMLLGVSISTWAGVKSIRFVGGLKP